MIKIEYLDISQIKSYERNARMHSPDQVNQLVNSINQFGFTNPVLVDGENVLIAGHGRLAAAKEIGMNQVPAIRLGNLSENQIKALRIADNQLALNATWDIDLLTAELTELSEEDFDLDVIGFDDDFLNGLLEPDEEIEDGYGAGEGEAGDDEEAADVGIVIGPYRCNIPRKVWDKWETKIRADIGFDKSDIEKELKRRLRLD